MWISPVASRFFTIWAPREAQSFVLSSFNSCELLILSLFFFFSFCILWWFQRPTLCVCWFFCLEVSFLFHSGLLSFSCLVVSDFLWPHGLQHARLACPSLSPRVCSNSCPLSWWCHPTISSSVAPFSSCPQSFPASGSFPVSRLFPSNGQSVELFVLVNL